jgi:hypothetical protein
MQAMRSRPPLCRLQQPGINPSSARFGEYTDYQVSRCPVPAERATGQLHVSGQLVVKLPRARPP